MVALHAVKSLSWKKLHVPEFLYKFFPGKLGTREILQVLGGKKEVLSHCLFSEGWCRGGVVAAQAHYLQYAGDPDMWQQTSACLPVVSGLPPSASPNPGQEFVPIPWWRHQFILQLTHIIMIWGGVSQTRVQFLSLSVLVCP